MLRIGSTVVLLLIVLVAQAQNNFRSRQNGDWNQSSTWEEFVSGSFQLTSNTPTAASGTILIQNTHTVTVTANVSADQLTIANGGTLVISDGIDFALNNGSGTDLVCNGTIQFLAEGFLSGAGTFSINGTLRSGSLNAAGALVIGTTEGNLRTSALRTFSTSSRTTYDGVGAQFIGSGHPVTNGSITEIDNSNGVSFDQNGAGNTGALGRMSINGNLILTNGNLNVISTAAVGRSLALSGTIQDNGNFITVAGPTTNLFLEGSGDVSPFPFPPGSQTLSQFNINRPGNTVLVTNPLTLSTRITAGGNVILNGTLNARDIFVTSGTLDLNANATATGSVNIDPGTIMRFDGVQLSMGGNFVSSGQLSSDVTSTLTITGSTSHTSPMVFTGGSSLLSLTVNRTTAGTTATIGSPVTIASALNLTRGTLDNPSGNLTMANNSSIIKSSEGSITTASPSGGPWNLTYTQNSQASGLEIPASGILSSLTISTAVTNGVTLSQSIVVNGALTITSNSLSLSCGTNNVTAGSITNNGLLSAPSSGASTGLTVNGNFVNNSTYTHNSGTLLIGGACTMSGTTISTTNFNSITITGSGNLTSPATLNIAGSFTNNGTFGAGTGRVVFNGGASSMLGTTMSTTTFNNVTINAGASVTQSTNFIVAGNLVINGTLSTGSNTTTFAGTTALTGTNIATTLFNHVVINPASTLTAPSPTFQVGGNFTVNGTFTAGTSTVLFAGTSSLLGTNINATNFNNVTVNGGATLTPSTTLNLQGNFANNGTFNAGAGTLAFIGSSSGKTLSGTTNTQFFNVSLNKTNAGTSVIVSSPQTVAGTLSLLDGVLDVGAGNLNLSSGATIIRTSLASLNASPVGGPWNLIYQGNSITTSVEIPASGTLVSLTIDVDDTRSVTLNQNITVQNAITIINAGRTLLCGTRNVTAGSISNGGTFSAPSNPSVNGLVVSGNFANNGTFTHNNGLVTFSGATTLSGTSTTGFNRLTISGTLNASVNFLVASHFTNNGTFNAPSLVTFNGSALQNFQGSTPTTTFRGIQVTNTASPVSLSLQSNINLVDSLTLASNAKVDADGSSDTGVLTLLSTSDAPAIDAKVSRLPSGAQVLGSVTVQRFFRPADNFDRFFSSPVTTATVAQLQAATPANSFPVTGDFPGSSFPCTGCNNNGQNFRYYQEANPGIINLGYKSFITSTSSTLTPGVGYDAFMWNGVSNTTVSLRGAINSGNVVLGVQPAGTGPGTSLTKTNNGVPSADGWNLVGNPYPSPIQWNNGSGWSRTNIDPTVWVWDVVGRVWHSYNANTSSGDLTNGVIASGQGFWVQVVSVGSGSITVNENAKSFGVLGTGSYFRTADGRQQSKGTSPMKISLSNGNAVDNAFVLSDPSATAGYDVGLDAMKLQIGIEQLSVSLLDESGNKMGHFAVNRQVPDRIPVYVYADRDGDFTLRFENTETVDAFEGYYLVDEYMNESKLIYPGFNHSFTMMAAEPLSMTDRFFLSRYPVAEKGAPLDHVSAFPNPATNQLTVRFNPERVQEISLMDISGRRLSKVETFGQATEIQFDLSTQPAGLYFLKVVSDGQVETRKILVKH